MPEGTVRAAHDSTVLRVFVVDPGIAVDRIVIDTGGLPPTYLAPPESHHPVFNAGPVSYWMVQPTLPTPEL
ncbi:hypothetical protein ACQEV2_38250 [Streptomyces sp. CA-251387]|uniref:hypothetical protein n=1 Tax=Streptomyces sp. CA-251387 TaxID=3240064 RepID=UPI003D93E70E